MSIKVLNIKSTGVFSCVLENGLEFADVDVTDTHIDARYQGLLQEMVDEMQSQNFQEIHLETKHGNKFVHKVGYNNFVAGNDPESYELFATMTEWTHRLQEGM